MALSPGNSAPDFSLVTMTPEGLKTVTLSDFRGQSHVVLLFFPAAFTQVCENEMCSVSDDFSTYEKLNAAVIAISRDSAWSQREWADKKGIKVTLVSDLQGQVIKAYDVVLADLAGMGPASQRAAFVIDKEGIIRYSEVTPTPIELPHFEEIRLTLESLS